MKNNSQLLLYLCMQKKKDTIRKNWKKLKRGYQIGNTNIDKGGDSPVFEIDSYYNLDWNYFQSRSPLVKSYPKFPHLCICHFVRKS
jgi:hypothetical protein